ncbi:MAG: HAMP domain-containing histidine kinase [Clostridia bacterium]|jgi:K+-sensing histidine kinase KdpD|nr:HAMP domain-containing histidine kinase [Clostridia bacterium]
MIAFGIGLALAKSIIKENNGYIDVEKPKEGSGTKFIIKYYQKI